jgi:Zn-finger nucleic acid-binding protein
VIPPGAVSPLIAFDRGELDLDLAETVFGKQGGCAMQVKPTQQEEEYFARLEFERRRNVLKERETQGAEEERQRILAVARGRCPRCAAELIPVPYRGVELDKCSGCQGVWLDFGELDQVVAEDPGFFAAVRKIFT